MENKIICFINIPSKEEKEKEESGLLHCFVQNKNINKAAYNNAFCNMFLYVAPNDLKYEQIFGKDAKNFLFISPKVVKHVAKLDEAPEKWNILLVHDSVQLKDILSVCTPETLILYHQKPEDAESTLKGNKTKYKFAVKGCHEPYDKYVLLWEIAKIWEQKQDGNWGFEQDKFDAAFKKIEEGLINARLEAVLEFLHGCLIKEPENFEKLSNEGINTEGLPMLKGKPNEDTSYIESLSDLRRELLKQVLP